MNRFIKHNFLYLFIPAIVCIIARVIFHFNGLFGQDSYEYIKIERGLHDYFFHTQEIPYSVFPIGYGLAGVLFSFFTFDDVLGMQLISVLALCIASIYLKKLLQFVYHTDYKTDIFLLVFFVLSPYVLRFGILVMSDMLCIAVYLIFLFHTFKFLSAFALKDLIVLCIAGSCCVFIRYASAVALFIPAIIILYQLLKGKKYMHLFIPVIIFLLIALPEYFLRDRFVFWDTGESKTGFAYFYVPEQWSFSNYFKNSFSNLDGFQQYAIPNIIFVFQNLLHPAFIFTGLLFLFFMRRIDLLKKEVKISLSIIIFYALFAAGYPYQSNRYLLFTFPLILILFYPAFSRLYQAGNIPKKLKAAGIIACTAVQIFLFVYSFQTIYGLNKTEKEIAETLKTYPGKNIYTFSIDGALNTYQVEYTFYDLYRIQFDTIQPNSLLVFNEQAFAVQFANLNPMKNYRFIKSKYKLEFIKEFESGWILYEIHTIMH